MAMFSTFFRAGAAYAVPRSSIRSATGLPRALIADHYRQAGLFGPDSDLSSAEQIMVQSRLGSLPGVPQVPSPDWSAARLRSLRLRLLGDYVDALIAGQGADDHAASLRSWGFSPSALLEVERTVHNVEDIFGPRSVPVKSDVRESTVVETAIARAA